jgi:hypothetical protein
VHSGSPANFILIPRCYHAKGHPDTAVRISFRVAGGFVILRFINSGWSLVGLLVGMGLSIAWVAALVYALHVF